MPDQRGTNQTPPGSVIIARKASYAQFDFFRGAVRFVLGLSAPSSRSASSVMSRAFRRRSTVSLAPRLAGDSAVVLRLGIPPHIDVNRPG